VRVGFGVAVGVELSAVKTGNSAVAVPAGLVVAVLVGACVLDTTIAREEAGALPAGTAAVPPQAVNPSTKAGSSIQGDLIYRIV
jgi:hypothetical protein